MFKAWLIALLFAVVATTEAADFAIPAIQMSAHATNSGVAADHAVVIDVDAFRTFNRPISIQTPTANLELKTVAFSPRQGGFSWRGRNDFGSEFVLTTHNGAVHGSLFEPAGTWSLEFDPRTRGYIWRSRTDFPTCSESGRVPQSGLMSAKGAGNTIETLIVYTAAARIAAGGVAQVEAQIRNSVDTLNAALADSQSITRFRINHLAEVQTVQDVDDYSTILTAIRGDGNPEIVALREQFGGDLVSVVVETEDPDRCGTGFVQANVRPGFSVNAYSVVRRTCATGNLSLAHEFGHNMGGEHEPESSSRGFDNPDYPNASATPDAFGHYQDGAFRTIMATSSQCDLGCPRMPNFSNPNVSVMSLPTGVIGERFFARTIDVVAEIVAPFTTTPIFVDGFEAVQ